MTAGALIPTAGLVRCEMTLVPVQTKRMGANGNSIIGVNGPSRWQLSVETVRLNLAQARTWSAWLNDRRERAETFTAFNLFRVLPAGTQGTADGSLTLTVDAPNSQVTIGGVGTGQGRVGDFVSYRTAANGYYVGEVREDANPAAGNLTVKLNPRPLPKHATTPAVRRFQALGEFDLSTDPGPFEDYVGRALSFEATQILRD